MLHLRSSPTAHYYVLGTLEGLLRAGCGRCLEDVLDHTTEDPPLTEGQSYLSHDEELSAAHLHNGKVEFKIMSVGITYLPSVDTP